MLIEKEVAIIVWGNAVSYPRYNPRIFPISSSPAGNKK